MWTVSTESYLEDFSEEDISKALLFAGWKSGQLHDATL